MCPCCDSLAQGFSKKKLAARRLECPVDRTRGERYTRPFILKMG